MSKTPRTDAFLKDADMNENVAEFMGTCRIKTFAIFARKLEIELTEAQKRFTAEDVRHVSLKILSILKEFSAKGDERIEACQTAFVLLHDKLLNEEKER